MAAHPIHRYADIRVALEVTDVAISALRQLEGMVLIILDDEEYVRGPYKAALAELVSFKEALERELRKSVRDLDEHFAL